MKNNIIFLLLALLVLFITSCSNESGVSSEEPTTGPLQLGKVSSSQWTYVSLDGNKVVGYSLFGSAAEDSLWYKRTDWDIALCGRYLRTNSGTSGMGKGGAAKVIGQTYEEIKKVPADSIKTDTLIIQ